MDDRPIVCDPLLTKTRQYLLFVAYGRSVAHPIADPTRDVDSYTVLVDADCLLVQRG
jgi:hypothetical protein